LGGEILPQTNGIYWTEVELSAPCDEELHRWFAECMITPEELALPHQTSSESFLFRTTKPPEHMVTVEVTRRGDVIPVEDAYIMIGMYKTSTDKEGIARLEVPGGKQELTVTKDDYLTFQTTVEINEDTSVKAELEFFQVF
jgi:hypothetical protein